MKKTVGLVSFSYKLYAGVIFLGTLLVFYPPIATLLRFEQHKKRTMPLFTLWSKVFRLFIGLPAKVQHETGTFPEGPFVICANHASYMDIVLMPTVLRKQHFLFMGKHEILSYPFLRIFFKRLHIPVNRNSQIQSAKSFIQASRAIKSGWSIALFPEGGIPDGQRPKMIPFKTGAFKLAMDNQVPVVPVTFVNNYKLFTDPEDLWGKARPGLAKVIVHAPITPEDYRNQTPEELAQHVYAIIDKPLRELY
jgi:1-acyl-sn-glycerol-3-phosphate acyltransferase